MSPSPGTSRFGVDKRADAEVAHLHEPERVDAGVHRLREGSFGPAHVGLDAHPDPETAGEVDGVVEVVQEPDVDAQ